MADGRLSRACRREARHRTSSDNSALPFADSGDGRDLEEAKGEADSHHPIKASSMASKHFANCNRQFYDRKKFDERTRIEPVDHVIGRIGERTRIDSVVA